MMKRWIMTAAVALAIAVAGCTRQHAVSTVWPDIANPQQLMNDAAVLLTTYRMENVASNAWPAAIKDLTPRYIHVGRAAVYVVLSAAGVWPAEGYLVFPDRREVADAEATGTGTKVLSRACPGVFKAQTLEP